MSESSQIIISKEIVHSIFTARIEGNKIVDIAKDYPFSEWTVREILKRNKGGEFKLTAEMNNYRISETPRKKSTPKSSSQKKRVIIDSVMTLVEAKRDFQRAILNALQGGLTKAEVNRIIDPIMEKANGS